MDFSEPGAMLPKRARLMLRRLRQPVGQRASEQGLASAARPVEKQRALALELVLAHHVAVEAVQSEHLFDLLDLTVEAADLVERLLRRLLQEELVAAGAFHLLEGDAEGSVAT